MNFTPDKVGQKSITFGSMYEAYAKKFSAKGGKKLVKNIYQSQAEKQALGPSEDYSAEIAKLTLIAQLKVTMTTKWALAVQLPLQISEYKMVYSGGETDREHLSQLGDVRFLSSERLIRKTNYEVSLFQGFTFPSAERKSTAQSVEVIQTSGGYAATIGAELLNHWTARWYGEWIAAYNMKFGDKVLSYRLDEELERDPGDEIFARFLLGRSFSGPLKAEVGVSHVNKAKDKVQATSEESNEFYGSATQSFAHLNVKYTLNQVLGSSKHFDLELQYQDVLAGQSAIDSRALGLYLSTTID